MFTITDFHSCDDDLYWYGCYDQFKDWKKFVTPESFAHPAKMSPVLCDRIFKHLKKHNLLKEGDTVVDFMAGINTTGIMATIHGCNSIAIELEPHFIDMINANKEQIESRSGRKINWEIIKGDSRNLSELLEDKGFVGVVSPPYSDSQTHPSLGHAKKGWGESGVSVLQTQDKEGQQRYSPNPSNIGNLPDKSLVGITSPPYTQGREGGGLNKNPPETFRGVLKNHSFIEGESEGQIGNLPDKQLIGVVSPPFENQVPFQDKQFMLDSIEERAERQKRSKRSHHASPEAMRKQVERMLDSYSSDNDNIGNQEGESYLQAMLQVYSEAYKSGISPLVTVTKNPTRGGKLRRLDLDTINLLLVVGYRILDYHRAVLFEERKQMTFDGEIKNIPKGRLSFFKRLSYDKGNIVARWEDIIIAVI